MRFWIVVAVLTVGSGRMWGGSTTTTPTKTATVNEGVTPPSKAEFIRRADAICQRFNEQTQPLEDQYRDLANRSFPSDAQIEQAADVFRRGVDAAREGAQDLRALTPPRGDEDVINNWLITGEAGIPSRSSSRMRLRTKTRTN